MTFRNQGNVKPHLRNQMSTVQSTSGTLQKFDDLAFIKEIRISWKLHLIKRKNITYYKTK